MSNYRSWVWKQNSIGGVSVQYAVDDDTIVRTVSSVAQVVDLESRTLMDANGRASIDGVTEYSFDSTGLLTSLVAHESVARNAEMELPGTKVETETTVRLLGVGERPTVTVPPLTWSPLYMPPSEEKTRRASDVALTKGQTYDSLLGMVLDAGEDDETRRSRDRAKFQLAALFRVESEALTRASADCVSS